MPRRAEPGGPGLPIFKRRETTVNTRAEENGVGRRGLAEAGPQQPSTEEAMRGVLKEEQ